MNMQAATTRLGSQIAGWRLNHQHLTRRWTRGLFTSTNEQHLVDLTSALCLPPSASTVFENDAKLALSGDHLIQTRWSSSFQSTTKNNNNQSCLIQYGRLKQQAMIWENDLLMDDSSTSTELYLVKARLLHQIYMELGEYDEAVQSLTRSGLINSGKASDPTHVGCAFGMMSFAMQQQRFFSQAEELASRALGIFSGDLWAIISVVETYQQQGRAREGLRFLRETESEWKESVLEPVLLGRRAFLHLELGDQDQCLREMEQIYSHLLPLLTRKEDNLHHRLVWDHWMMADLASLSHSISMAEKYFNLNADSLLSNQNEWPERPKQSAFDGTFSTLMKLSCNWPVVVDNNKEENVVFLSNSEFEPFKELEDTNQNAFFFVQEDDASNRNDVVAAVETWGVPLIQALQGAYQTDLGAKQVKDLLRVRRNLNQIGGLASMRDAIAQTAFLTALRWAKSSRDPQAFNLARALSLERLSQRPGSPQVWFWHSQLCAEMGDMAMAHNAKTRAVDLGLGQGGQFGD